MLEASFLLQAQCWIEKRFLRNDTVTETLRSFRHRAEYAFREAHGLDAERVIETRAVIFPRDRRGQLDHLFLIEVCAQAVEELVRNMNGRFCHRHGILQNQFL